MKRIRIGIVGCGAITEDAHLPAALASHQVELAVLSDSNGTRLNSLARAFNSTVRCCADYREVFDLVDAVILALPNHLHGPVGCDFLQRGIHVLCEKPLATSVAVCEQMCKEARATQAVLAVGYVTRFYPSTELTKALIREEFLGRIESLDYEFGTAGGWAPVSGYNISRETSGGGVLAVSGSHFIDRMLYFFSKPQILSYADDSRGGVEANCLANFELEDDRIRFPAKVTLSKTHQLDNRLRIVGERGSLVVNEGQKHSVMYMPSGGGPRHEIHSADLSPPSVKEHYWQVQLEDFVSAIRTCGVPRVDGEAGLASVRLIEECYLRAVPLAEPWVDATVDRITAVISRSASVASAS